MNVLPVGVLGDDEAGRLLLKNFRHKRIPLSGVLKDKSYTTVTKTRILAGMTHTCARSRWFAWTASRKPSPTAHLKRELVLAAREYARASDALLVSDYGYGAATPAILNAIRETGRLESCPCHPRFAPPHAASSPASLPRRPMSQKSKKLSECRSDTTGRVSVSAGAEIMSRMKLHSLLITRGRDGMVAFDDSHKPVDIPIFGSDEVTDVTGAGDTVIATFTAALAAGASTEEAAHLANYAGGIVVMKRGTATVSQQELLHAIEKAPPANKIPLSTSTTTKFSPRAAAAPRRTAGAAPAKHHSGQRMLRPAACRARALSARRESNSADV